MTLPCQKRSRYFTIMKAGQVDTIFTAINNYVSFEGSNLANITVR